MSLPPMAEQAPNVSHETGLSHLFAAGDALRRALLEPGVIRHSEDITVELSYGSGLRFERWIKHHAPPTMAMSLPYLFKDDGATRSITIEGIKFAYPTCIPLDHPWRL